VHSLELNRQKTAKNAKFNHFKIVDCFCQPTQMDLVEIEIESVVTSLEDFCGQRQKNPKTWFKFS